LIWVFVLCVMSVTGSADGRNTGSELPAFPHMHVVWLPHVDQWWLHATEACRALLMTGLADLTAHFAAAAAVSAHAVRHRKAAF
jgi:hypothetical protein